MTVAQSPRPLIGRSVHNYFRDYDPATGRYVESDLVGLAAGINTYSYTVNNPLWYVDPLGLDVEICSRPADLPFPLNLFTTIG